MNPPTITAQADLLQLCERLKNVPEIGIDTEFVSEDTFVPELCLIQIASRDELAVVDTLAVDDLLPFWSLLAEGEHVTVLHAGREELNFLLRACGKLPQNLFDIQIAAAFCSHEFPSAYGTLVSRFLGHKPMKGEQRTDWRRRPLSAAQINYALEDVRYLFPMYDHLKKALVQSDRLWWFEEEIVEWQKEVAAAFERKDWRRVSGIGKLKPRNLAIVRELWLWRQAEAEQRNLPPRRVLRDDLIVELAKRKVDKAEQITAVRGMQRGSITRKADELAACVRRGLEAPVERIPRAPRLHAPPQLNLLGQFLTPALATICRQAEVATSIVGTASDVRALIAHRMGFAGAEQDEVPVLTRGWRALLVGNLIDDLLDGKKSIRITDAQVESPLAFDEVRD